MTNIVLRGLLSHIPKVHNWQLIGHGMRTDGAGRYYEWGHSYGKGTLASSEASMLEAATMKAFFESAPLINDHLITSNLIMIDMSLLLYSCGLKTTHIRPRHHGVVNSNSSLRLLPSRPPKMVGELM